METNAPISLRFAAAARDIANAARAQGLASPIFRSPPARGDLDRSIRRHRGRATVSIRTRGRPWSAVMADLVEGVVVVNGLIGPAAARARSGLWAALESPQAEAA